MSDENNLGSILIAGCGYTGTRIAANLVSEARQVIALTAQSEVSIENVESLQVDFDVQEGPLELGGDLDCVVYLVPPPRSGVTDSRIRNFLENILPNPPKRLVLISTTGVYGNCNGTWVDEDTQVNPRTAKAKRRLDAEMFATDWSANNNVDLVILRVGAIYGPGRLPVEKIQRGMMLPPAGESGFVNRVHVHDLAEICIAAAKSESSGVFNVSDGEPLKMVEFMHLVSDIWGLARVVESSSVWVSGTLGSDMRQYLSESRKIDNSRMLQTFSIELEYPTAEQGLKSCYRKMIESDLEAD